MGWGRFVRSLRAGAAALIVWFFASAPLAAHGAANIDSGSALTLNSPGSFVPIAAAGSVNGIGTVAGRYLEISISSSTQGDQLGIAQSSTPSIVDGNISVVGGVVFIGDGSVARRFGAIDRIRNGRNGAPLRINFDAFAFIGNTDFESNSLTGWTSINGPINLGSTVIAGVPSVDAQENTPDYPVGSRNTTVRNDDGGNFRPDGSNGVTTNTGTRYGVSMNLTASGRVYVADNASVVNTVGVYSDQFSAKAGSVISYQQRVISEAPLVSNQDASARFWAALLRTDGTMPAAERWIVGSYDVTDLTTNWSTRYLRVPQDGSFRIVFVGGLGFDDNAGSQPAGTKFRLDEFAIDPGVTDEAMTMLLRAVQYGTTESSPRTKRTVAVSVGDSSSVLAQDSKQISIPWGTDPTPIVTPTPTPTLATPTPLPVPSDPSTPTPTSTPAAAPAPTAAPPLLANLSASLTNPAVAASVAAATVLAPPKIEFTPGAAVANPAIGATGNDAAPPAPFNPLASPESIVAVGGATVMGGALATNLAPSASAPASSSGGGGSGGGAAASARGGSSSGSGGGSSGGGATAARSTSGSSAGTSAGGSSTQGNQSSGSGPDSPPEFGGAGTDASTDASGSDTSGGGGDGDGGEGGSDFGELDLELAGAELVRQGWGDRLWLWQSRRIVALDRISTQAINRLAPFSPLAAKLVLDGAYLRALFGLLALVPTVAALFFGVLGAHENAGAVTTPPWQILLAISLMGAMDAFAGFMGALGFVVFMCVWATSPLDIGALRLSIGIFFTAIAPSLAMTAFRDLRREAETSFSNIWERLTDLAIGPLLAGVTMTTIISAFPAVLGTTLSVANHVKDFAVFAAAAAMLRILCEEIASRYYPARLNQLNPTEVPEPLIWQQWLSLGAKYAIWLAFTTAIVGPIWQVWIGSLIFIIPSILDKFADRFPNVPFIWHLLPTGLPGLNFGLVINALTLVVLTAIFSASPTMAAWNMVFSPLPMFVVSLLRLFGREPAHAETERWTKRNVWVFRLGGIVMFLASLRLMSVI